MAQELEIKLTLARRHVPDVIDWLLATGNASDQGQRLLVNRYYDTPRSDLNNRKIALRVRQKGDRYIQTLKTQGEFVDGAHRRQEWEWDLRGPELNLGLLADTPVGQGVNLAELSPVFETNFERRVFILEEGKTSIEVAVDAGQILAADRSRPLSEVEFELKSGNANALMGWAIRLAGKVPVFLNLVSKAEQGYYLAGLHQPPMPDQEAGDVWSAMTLLSALSQAWLSGQPLRMDAEKLTGICETAETLGEGSACRWLCEQLEQGGAVTDLALNPRLGQFQLALAGSRPGSG